VSIDVVLDAPERIVTFEGLDEIEWLLPNSGASGYYRWQLAGDAFARLAAVASKRLAPHEQRHLLDDALALLHAEQLDSSILLEVVRGACRSEEPLVALGVLDALQSVRLPLARGGVTRGWRRFLSSCLEPTFLRVGLDPRPGELPKVSDLRPALLERLGVQGADSRIRAWASSQLDAILSGRSAVDLSLQEVALRIVAEEGDLPLWERYWRRAESTTDPAERDRLLRGLMAFRRPVPFEATLALAAEDKLRPDEMFLPLFIPRAYPEWSPRLVEWMETAYPAYERRLSPDHRAILGVVGVGCDTALFDRAAAFLSATEPDNPALASRLGRAGDRTRACASLRAREESRAEAYLGRFQDD
jgi:alanyl aminopeptidase